MTAQSPECFLLLSDDALLLRTLAQLVAGRAQVVAAADAAHVFGAQQSSVRGVIIDGALVAQQTLRQLSRLRAAYPLANILFLASPAQANLLNELQPLRIEVLMRPLPPEALGNFIERAQGAGKLSGASVRAWIGEVASECRLTGRELALMPLVLEEETPEKACARLGLDQDALQRSLRRLVKKCRVRNVDRLAKNIMRDALLFSRSCTAELIEPMASDAASF